MLAWGSKVSPEFRERVIAICDELNFNPDWLMACMAFETIQTFSPSIRPRLKDGTLISSAVGLIQFMKATAIDLGTTTAALSAMTAETQLDYVRKYFAKSIKAFGPVASLEDCYMHIHYPANVGKPIGSTMYVNGSKAYAANHGLDADHDGRVTKAEAAARVTAMLELGRSKYAA